MWGCVRTLRCARFRAYPLHTVSFHTEVVNFLLAFLTNLVVMKRICLPSPGASRVGWAVPGYRKGNR